MRHAYTASAQRMASLLLAARLASPATACFSGLAGLGRRGSGVAWRTMFIVWHETMCTHTVCKLCQWGWRCLPTFRSPALA